MLVVQELLYCVDNSSVANKRTIIYLIFEALPGFEIHFRLTILTIMMSLLA